MEVTTLPVLAGTAATIALVHTVVGVDHSLPFVVIGRVRGWSLRKVMAITALCGLGHVASSVALGAVGIGMGVAVERLAWIEGVRGGWAAWLLIGFGFLFAARGLWRNFRNRAHDHLHTHPDGTRHAHPHGHQGEHLHVHEGGASLTVWALFVIFLLGPCEPLIPLLMAPAAMHHPGWVIVVTAVFAAVTLATMLVTVMVGYLGLGALTLGRLKRHADTFAGLSVAGSGLAIQWLGI